MALPLFGSRSPLQRLLASNWKDEDEKNQLLTSLREDAGLKAGELIPLLWSARPVDAATRSRRCSCCAPTPSAVSRLLVTEMQSQGTGGAGLRACA
ncbi:MAG: hypothetical protein V9G19_27735 [Tetrasphaera sp.]